MTIKRLVLALLVVAMAIAPAAHAQNAPTCADEHLTGEDCQGPDVDLSENWCEIKVWVGKASCDMVVPDDYAGSVGIGGKAWADQGTVPELDLVIRDKATGTVLRQSHLEGQPSQVDPSKVTDAVGRTVDNLDEVDPWFLLSDIQHQIVTSVEDQVVRGTWTGSGGTLDLTPGTVVTCEASGTHSQLGAATAAIGETPDPWAPLLTYFSVPQRYNNDFACNLFRQNSDPMPIAPGVHGCVAMQPAPPPELTSDNLGSTCDFRGEPTGVPSGVVSGTTGSWTVTHQGPSGTVVDLSGSGPGAVPHTFTRGVLYTLTVNGDGQGAVAAGSPE